jgi:predicted  nucleic acid-binding Zn-ribbon protein
MARRILTAFLIYFSALLILLSAAGIALIWLYNAPLTNASVSRMQSIDSELTQAQSAIRSARGELQRTLRIVEGAEKSLSSLKDQTDEAKKLFDQFNKTLDNTILPGLQSTRGGINQVRAAIQGLRETLQKINAIPLLNLTLPGDQVLANLIKGVDSLNSQISGMQELVHKAEVFTSDTSYLLGGDMTETKQHIHQLLDSLIEYDRKVTAWHVQARHIVASLPGWIDRASIILTIFLLWFGFSQFGLLLHGLNMRDGRDPLAALRRPIPAEAVGE